MPQFAPLQNDTFLRALLRQPTDYTPVWLMRQAGRYLPEYRATRAKAGSFMGLAKNPDFATEVTLQPIDRYPLDASILFSDILTVPDAMGLGLYFEDGEGPKFERNVRTEADVAALRVPDMASLQYVFDAVTSIRTALNGRVPLIGFSGSPWTLACYMVEGGGSREFHTIKKMLYSRPDLMHRILDVNAEAVAQYLNAQIDAGAQAVMIFDSWGGALADGAYQAFSLDYMRKVVAKLQREKDGVRIPSIMFTKGGGLWLDEMADVGADALGLDWTVNLGRARAGRRPRGPAGQPRPRDPVRRPGPDPRRGGKGAHQLRHPVGRPWPCVQPGARHLAIHAAGVGDGDGRRGARGQPSPARRLTTPRAVRFLHRIAQAIKLIHKKSHAGRVDCGNVQYLTAYAKWLI
jgi:uroporphyrinogen decarboxylase